MKAHLLLPILTIAAGLSARAQSPNTPPPPAPPQAPGNAGNQGPGQQDGRRERYRKMAEYSREHHTKPGDGRQQGNSQERAEHIREAMMHLKAAGLGQMAERIEEMLKKGRDGRGPGQSPPGQPQAQQPQRPFGPSQQFTRPLPFGPGPRGGPGARPDGGSNEDLRAQVQQLARQVEEIRQMLRSRGGEHHDGRPGPTGDQPKGKAQGDGERKERRPQGDQPQGKTQGDGERKERRPQGDQPPRPQGDGPRREQRDNPPQPNRDGVEEIKPALLPQTDSIE